eukprot:GHUV01032150.1.p1 GENE.GHUV01032150.1~~GHUV01032150.1.p1  ORF type:complete len:105 (-),score=32.67 GHUV01032150.1:405-719(-)
MPSILMFPLLPFILEVGLIIYWVAVTAVLYSAGYPMAHWRTAAEQVKPLSFQQLMLTNSSMSAPAATTQPNITGMSNEVGLPACDAYCAGPPPMLRRRLLWLLC